MDAHLYKIYLIFYITYIWYFASLQLIVDCLNIHVATKDL